MIFFKQWSYMLQGISPDGFIGREIFASTHADFQKKTNVRFRLCFECFVLGGIFFSLSSESMCQFDCLYVLVKRAIQSVFIQKQR